MTLNHPLNSLQRFFVGVAEYTFQTRLGVADVNLVDYISELLVRFIRYDAVFKVRNLTGRQLGEIGEMLMEAEQRIGEARRDVHQHIGDFALFWAGLYPESLRPRRMEEIDRFVDYCVHGKRAYAIASTIDTDVEEAAPGEVLHCLSEQFEMCAYGLREVRREWERRDDGEMINPLWIN